MLLAVELAAARVEALGMAAGRCWRLRSDPGSFYGEAATAATHRPADRPVPLAPYVGNDILLRTGCAAARLKSRRTPNRRSRTVRCKRHVRRPYQPFGAQPVPSPEMI